MAGRNNDKPGDPLPEGVPEPPDMTQVRDLRERMKEDRADRSGRPRIDPNSETGKQARDIGTYTIIPMMMIAGPLVGYLLGKGWEKLFGGEPWPAVVGLLVGTVAAFRQVFLMLAQKSRQGRKK